MTWERHLLERSRCDITQAILVYGGATARQQRLADI